MAKIVLTTAITILISIQLLGQGKQLPYESKMADLGEIQMQYMDFGGEGIPVIWVQDFHNYFEGPYEDSKTVNYIAEISKHTRLLAPLRRGYGKSTDTQWGYDVARQAEDLLDFMDALNLDKAILMGRQPANQDMTWIAEHHPERLSGLIYWGGDPILIVGCSYTDELLLMENWSAMAPDFKKGKEKRVVMSRAFWRPDFLKDTSSRIDIPAIRILNTTFSNSSVIRRLSEPQRMQSLINRDMPGFEDELFALRKLGKDSLRMKKLRDHLLECDPTKALSTGMERTFGNKLKTVEKTSALSTEREYEEFMQWEILETIKFIEEIKN